MSENQKRILEMLENKKISVDEAYRLLSVLEPEGGATQGPPKTAAAKPRAKYLRVSVVPRPGHRHDEEDDDDEDEEDDDDDEDEEDDDGGAELVNVRVPMSLIRAGMKFTSLIPPTARDKITGALREKGIDFDMRNLKPEDLEEMIEALSELEVNVVTATEVVKVSVE